MALTAYQRSICQLLAAQRIASGESYVAGSSALNLATGAARISQDIDLFHDTAEAVNVSWEADRRTLVTAGYMVTVKREREGFVEALVSQGNDRVEIQWTSDSAFRFFPLQEHPDFGLTLHPFDLATNKVLALVGRLEVRDWVDLIACHAHIQPLGYLAWAAAGKDAGFGPTAILEHAARSSRYSAEEVATLNFAGPAPEAAALSYAWREILCEARDLCGILPPETAGHCVLSSAGELFSGSVEALHQALKTSQLRFHAGRIRGALPQLRNRE